MGYACPVCESPQADAEHLANHLAFTALLGREDHETWLDERVPDWADRGPADLGAAVADHAEETDYPRVFEDTTDADGHEHDPDAAFEAELARQAGYGRDARAGLDDEVARTLDEARDLTRRMHDADGEDGDAESE